MEGPIFARGGRGRGGTIYDGSGGRGRPTSRNKHWSASEGGSRTHTLNSTDSERWERGGYRGGGRGRGGRGNAPKFHNVSLRLNNTPKQFTSPDQPPQLPTDEESVYENVDQDMNGQVEEDEEDDGSGHVIQEPELDNPEEREKFYQEVCT